MDKFYQWGVSVVIGTLASMAKEYGLIIFLVVLAIVLDVVTGLVKCKIKDIKISSETGRKGFFRKFTLILALSFGIFIDSFIPYLLSVVDVGLEFNSPFGLIIGVYIILNESISICENLYESNPESVPKSIVNMLKIAEEKLEGDNEDDENMS